MPFLLSHDIPQRMPSQVLELVQQSTGCRHRRSLHCRHIERADLADSAFVRNAMLVPDTAAWQVLIAFAMAWSPRHAFVSMVHVFLPTPIQA